MLPPTCLITCCSISPKKLQGSRLPYVWLWGSGLVGSSADAGNGRFSRNDASEQKSVSGAGIGIAKPSGAVAGLSDFRGANARCGVPNHQARGNRLCNRAVIRSIAKEPETLSLHSGNGFSPGG